MFTRALILAALLGLATPAIAGHESPLAPGDMYIFPAFCTVEAGWRVFNAIPDRAPYDEAMASGECLQVPVPGMVMAKLAEIHSIIINGVDSWVEMWQIRLPSGVDAVVLPLGENGPSI